MSNKHHAHTSGRTTFIGQFDQEITVPETIELGRHDTCYIGGVEGGTIKVVVPNNRNQAEALDALALIARGGLKVRVTVELLPKA